MPTVPTTFVPQVAPQGEGPVGDFVAPGIQPAENLSGQQVARFGQQLTQTGMAAYSVGSAIQEDIAQEMARRAKIAAQIQNGIDEAKTKEADVAAGRAMQAVSDKYMAMIGKDAESNYAAMQEELSKAGQSAMGMLDNDVQRRMLSPILARNMGIFESRMGQHRVQQLRVYQTNEATARAELSADYAIQAYPQRNLKDAEGRPVGLINYAANADTAIEEIRKAGELMGYAADSAQMKQLEQKVYDRMAVGIVNVLLAEKDYAGAADFLSDSATVEKLDAKTKQLLSESVESNRQRTVVSELATSIKENGIVASKSDPKTYGQKDDGNAEPPFTLREALVLSEQIEDDQMRKFVQTELRSRFAQEDALIKQEYDTLIFNVEQFLAVPGNSVSDISPNMWGRLFPSDRARYMSDYESRQIEKNDMQVKVDMAINPAKYSTVAEVDGIRKSISPQLYVQLRSRLNEPEKIIDAQVDADDINRQLIDMDMSRYVNPSKGSKESERALIFRNNVTQMIEIRQREKGGKIGPDEKRDIIRKAIVDEAWIRRTGTDIKIPTAMMTSEEYGRSYVIIGDEEVPQLQYAIAEQQLRDAGIASPSESQIINVWITKGRPR